MIIQKYLNASGVAFSWLISSVIKRPIVLGMPYSVGVELTNRCNLSCPECASGAGKLTRPSGFMSEELFRKVVSELGKYMINTMFYFQGESMLHPRFFDFLGMAGGMGVIISTNGHYLGKENVQELVRSGASRIIVSLDGISEASYTAYRKGGDVERVKEGILLLGREAAAFRGSPEIIIQALVNRYNQHEISGIKAFGARAGARVKLKSMQLFNPVTEGSFLPSGNKYRRYRSHGNATVMKGRLSNRCLRLWTNPVITWDGRVVPCCFDKNADYEMGNLNNSSFRDIWNGGTYREFRMKVLSDRAAIEICRNCTSGISRRVVV